MDTKTNQTEFESTVEHCAFCFDTIINFLKDSENFKTPELPKSIPRIKSPLFVTWHIYGDDLRGCIGTFAHQEIEKNLPKYALYSAFKDSRFDPISLKELPHLSCSVSLLINFSKAENPFDWEIGKHGINIDFSDKKGNTYGATFLPEVAKEQGWDKDTTLEHLIRKGGYRGKNWRDVLSTMTVEKYESSKVELTYEQYKQLKGGKIEL